ncbi:carboxypeptidase regulatory-like domain-containing protein [Anaerobaca lacustris]|uniref:Carboxypeptidase regulatory-like domain-containing protein n=1 Tax=Anaerobaca lacustris TaxID=3044600 RepID=A0AAW6TVK7_9BACT|nr:carboxypeptidase regulatory-like domain-containing protein [Sedimentisphaerales bacterium M17dextr]
MSFPADRYVGSLSLTDASDAVPTRKMLHITGQVQDARLDSVGGAEVAVMELMGDDYTAPKSAELLDAIQTTDQEGHFAVDVWVEPKHDILVVARKTGLALGWEYIYREHPLMAQPYTSFTANIVLCPPGGIAGRLVDSEGHEVADADIQAVPQIRNGGKAVYGPKDWLSKITDAQGRFVFDQLPVEATVRFFVKASGRDIAYIFPPGQFQGNACEGYRVDWEDVELKLPPAATLRGRVLDKTTDRGIRGLRLMLSTDQSRRSEWRFRPLELISDTEGAFEVQSVPPGRHTLQLVSERTDWVARHVPIEIREQEKTVNVSVQAEKGIPLEVLVRDRTTGRALPEITVHVDDREHDEQQDILMQRGETDANGIAKLHMPRGQYKMHAWGGNYNAGFKGIPLIVTGPQTTPVEITVTPQLPLVRGTVVDTQGQPAEDVRVMVGLGQTVLTDKQGRFAARQNPLYASNLVVVQDVERDLAGATFFYDAVRELRVVLKPSSSIRGRVTDDMGRGIAGARVSLQLGRRRRGGGRDIHGVVHLPGTRTDAQGYYELTTVVPLEGVADHYLLTYESAEFGSSDHVLDDPMTPGEAAVLPNIQLMPLDAHLSGVVLDQNNHPVPGKPVFVGNNAGGFPDKRATCTDEQGQFRVNRLPAGPVSVQVDFGQGNDAAYVFAHSGDHVTIKLGQHFTNFVPRDSLVGGSLPDLRTLEIGFDARRIRNKKVLVVFVDYGKRASQIAIRQLQRFSREFRHQNVAIVCIQVAPADEDELRQWKRQNKITLPIDVLPGHGVPAGIPLLQESSGIMSALRQPWGVRSLPWVVLTDEHQQIVATGVNVGRVLTLVQEQGRAPSPLQSLRRRR